LGWVGGGVFGVKVGKQDSPRGVLSTGVKERCHVASGAPPKQIGVKSGVGVPVEGNSWFKRGIKRPYLGSPS